MGRGLEPFIGKIFVEPVDGMDKERVSVSGIIESVHSEEDGSFVRGNIVAVGKGFPYPEENTNRGTKRAPMELNVGDVVIYVRSSAVKTKYDGKEYFIISEKDIFAVDPA